jgi:hypothetical protein
MTEEKAVIHISRSIDYLFDPSTSTVLCGQIAQNVFDKGEFIGVLGNLNSKCIVCMKCKENS